MSGSSNPSPTFDVIIRGGRIVDGAGNPWFRADVGIDGGRIVKIGNLSSAEGEKAIYADGLTVCPGFIDIHNHSDITLLINPRADSMVRQGVTTQVTGNCGYSCAPVRDATKALLENYLFGLMPEVEIDWHTLGEYLHRLEKQGIATNVAPLVAHGAVRVAVLGWANRLPRPKELEDMRNLVASAMEDGAFGMSTGLAYAPGMFSNTREIIELARVVTRYGGLYASHVRSEVFGWEEAVREAMDIGEKAEIRVQVSHVESHIPNWGKQETILNMLEGARGRGLDVTCDIPPYLCGFTSATAMLPPWALEGGCEKILERLRDPEAREKIKKFVLTERESHVSPITALLAGGLSNKIWIASSEKNPDSKGKSLAEIAGLRKKDPLDAALDVILEEEGGTLTIVGEVHSEDDLRKVVEHPLSMIESDGLAWAPDLEAGAKPHPRFYGVFPLTFRKYVRGETREEEPKEVGEKIITLEEAVRKMTSFPAQKLGLRDRGLIREGMWADIVIFDPEAVEDQATYANPHQYPKGIPYVLVNGQVVVEKGEHTGALPGEVLRGPGYSAIP